MAGTSSAQTPSAVNQRFALIIGIKGYPHFKKDEQLHYADNDALRISAFVQSPQGGSFPKENVRVLLNAYATRAGISRELKRLGAIVGANDVLYVFFAGHGVKDDSNRAYLMPYDADPDDPGGLGFRADLFFEDVKTRISAKFMVFFIDACHAGATLVSGGASRGDENITPALNNAWNEVFKDQKDIVRMGIFSASSSEKSWEDHDLKQGIFTYFLAKGLEGAADNSPLDGVVTAGELYRYVAENVEEYSKRKFEHQTPIPSPTFVSSFPMAVYSNVQGAAITFPSLNNFLLEKNKTLSIVSFEVLFLIKDQDKSAAAGSVKVSIDDEDGLSLVADKLGANEKWTIGTTISQNMIPPSPIILDKCRSIRIDVLKSYTGENPHWDLKYGLRGTLVDGRKVTLIPLNNGFMKESGKSGWVHSQSSFSCSSILLKDLRQELKGAF